MRRHSHRRLIEGAVTVLLCAVGAALLVFLSLGLRDAVRDVEAARTYRAASMTPTPMPTPLPRALIDVIE